MNSEKIKRLCVDSMLAALCAVLGFFAIDLGNFKFTPSKQKSTSISGMDTRSGFKKHSNKKL